MGVLLWILLIIMYLTKYNSDVTLNMWSKITGIIFLQYIYSVKNKRKYFKSSNLWVPQKCMIFEYWFRCLSKSMGSITIYLSLSCLSKRVLYVTCKILFNLMFLMPVNIPYPGRNDRKLRFLRSLVFQKGFSKSEI